MIDPGMATNYTRITTPNVTTLISNGDSVVIHGYVTANTGALVGALTKFFEADGVTLIDEVWTSAHNSETTFKPFLASKGFAVQIVTNTTTVVTVFHSASGK